ncbi:hypothetical protein ACFLZY_02870 [Patescibacteria group bacterium]
MTSLDKLPGWVKRLDELSSRMSTGGLHGLLDHHKLTNRLGELLTSGEIKSKELSAWLESCQETPKVVSRQDISAWRDLQNDPQAFWQEVWNEILDREVEVPSLSKLKKKTIFELDGHSFMLMFIPELTEDDYPAGFIKPNWGRYLDISDVKRLALPGRWVAVETIFKPNWDDKRGYGHGRDTVAEALGLESRFYVSWDSLKATHLPALAKVLSLRKAALRLTSAEEWNLVGNLFLWLQEHREMKDLFDLGSTNSWEWCENTSGAGARLVVGCSGRGGLAGVGVSWPGSGGGRIGFRALAVL